MKLCGIDTTRDDDDVLITGAAEFLRQPLRRHQGCLGAIMEFAQIACDRRFQPTKTIVPAIAVKVGMKIGSHRQAQFLRRANRRPAERPLGDHMHEIRALLLPQPDQSRLGRQATLESAIIRNRHAIRQHFFEAMPLYRSLTLALPRPHQLHGMSAAQQAIDHAPEGHGNAVDFRGKGFGDQRNPQLQMSGRQRLNNQVGSHGDYLAASTLSFDETLMSV